MNEARLSFCCSAGHPQTIARNEGLARPPAYRTPGGPAAEGGRQVAAGETIDMGIFVLRNSFPAEPRTRFIEGQAGRARRGSAPPAVGRACRRMIRVDSRQVSEAPSPARIGRRAPRPAGATHPRRQERLGERRTVGGGGASHPIAVLGGPGGAAAGVIVDFNARAANGHAWLPGLGEAGVRRRATSRSDPPGLGPTTQDQGRGGVAAQAVSRVQTGDTRPGLPPVAGFHHGRRSGHDIFLSGAWAERKPAAAALRRRCLRPGDPPAHREELAPIVPRQGHFSRTGARRTTPQVRAGRVLEPARRLTAEAQPAIRCGLVVLGDEDPAWVWRRAHDDQRGVSIAP